MTKILKKRSYFIMGGTYILFLILTFFYMNKNKSEVNINTKYDVRKIQRAVDLYYYDNVRFPTLENPTIGNPQPISLGLLKNLNSSDILKDVIYYVDYYGDVFALNNTFLPPNNVEIINDDNGKVYISWDDISNADSFTIKEVVSANVDLNKYLGKITATLFNVSSRGTVVVSAKTDDFIKNNGRLFYHIENYDPNKLYIVIAKNNELGETPGIKGSSYFLESEKGT